MKSQGRKKTRPLSALKSRYSTHTPHNVTVSYSARFHLGILKAKLAKLKAEVISGGKGGGGKAGDGFDVTKSGDIRVGMVCQSARDSYLLAVHAASLLYADRVPLGWQELVVNQTDRDYVGSCSIRVHGTHWESPSTNSLVHSLFAFSDTYVHSWHDQLSGQPHSAPRHARACATSWRQPLCNL